MTLQALDSEDLNGSKKVQVQANLITTATTRCWSRW
jgi:hypothetical protein